MFRITFDFNPDTEQVSNFSCSKADKTASPSKTTRKSKSKSLDNKITLNGNSLKLNQDVLDKLGVKVSERVCIRFNPGPVLVRPDVSGETNGGNLITKSMTVSVRGKTGETMAKFGSEFVYELESDGFLVLKTEDEAVLEEGRDHLGLQDTPQEEIDQNILDDLDFTATIEDGQEIDFSFDI